MKSQQCSFCIPNCPNCSTPCDCKNSAQPCQSTAGNGLSQEEQLIESQWCQLCDPKCEKCHHQFENWCNTCCRKKLVKCFVSGTSSNDQIDAIIQETQTYASSPYELVEWIDPNDFVNIEHLADGGFGSIYTATWQTGWWNITEDSSISRSGPKTVVLKTVKAEDDDVNPKLFNEVWLMPWRQSKLYRKLMHTNV